MLTAVSDSHWGYNYLLNDGAGVALARVKINWGRESGIVDLNGTMVEISRDGMTGPWHAKANGKVVGTIIKPSAFSRLFRLSVDSAQYSLVPRTWTWSSTYDVFAGQQCIGSLERNGFFRRKMLVNLSDDLPLMLRALAVWIVLLMWRRADSAAACS